MAEGFHLEQDEETLRRVIDLAVAASIDPMGDKEMLSPAFQSFLGQMVWYATGENRNWDEPQTLLDRASAAWAISAIREPGANIISLRREEAVDWRRERLVLDIVTEDQPFLVDSITGALHDAGKPLSFFVNAVVETTRDKSGARTNEPGEVLRESIIHAEMDPAVDDAEVEALHQVVEQVLADVAVAVADWEDMRARLAACIAQLERARPKGVRREEMREAIDFLKWLWDNRFAFIGVRRFTYEKSKDKASFAPDTDKNLGILRDQSRLVLKSMYEPDGSLAPSVEAFIQSNEPIIIAKANVKSNVHRRVHMDYIGVKIFSASGETIGEERFLGLFTAEAYNRPASDIPYLQAKVWRVVEDASFPPGSHNEKALINILDTYPRDEMFQVDTVTLAEISHGILRLYKRPRAKVFIRRDRFERFVSALVFVPRDRFNSYIRERIGAHLATTYNGRVSAFTPSFGDASLIRVHFIIGMDRGAPAGPDPDTLTKEIAAICREWRDDLADALDAGGAHSHDAARTRYIDAFEPAYRDRIPAGEAVDDIATLEGMVDKSIAIRAFRRDGDADDSLRLKLFSAGSPFTLSGLIPTLENLGLNVLAEASYQVSPKDARPHQTVWVHDFNMKSAAGAEFPCVDVCSSIVDALEAVLLGHCEDDGFNTLVMLAGLSWREAYIFRVATKYHVQSGFQYSQKYIEETLCRQPDITRLLLEVFHARFQPPDSANGESTEEDRARAATRAEHRVTDAIDGVSRLDDDRILRRFLSLFKAITRTNFYQYGEDGAVKPYIALKIDSAAINDLPDPKPYREIFVSGPKVDGVHLRFGPIARGGLRWSDRKEDFRTEVLDLVKAQRVKNAVIVPTGSKGGFYPKNLPAENDRDAIIAAGKAAYSDFIRGLLDLTDNVEANEITPPLNTVRWDDPDPYLVVAADKGTAAFSDTANAVAKDYRFWLGDAFASGGSEGYDHKVMGITARGAWESVKRHFREIGKNIQDTPFTAIGVGDMSGDVFGNGMLLSKKTKLIAAFDHRDIFIDPDPDPDISYAERERLFRHPRSSWKDYDQKLISHGGGIFSRDLKAIEVSQPAAAVLGVEAGKFTPQDLIQAILRAPVELLWFGGIGTYVKGADQTHSAAGDRGNDTVRINSDELRVQVVGEGANLGMTQIARVDFAKHGGRINTDAIDNSGGVDSSDHEVNIKIALTSAIADGALPAEKRGALLRDMTDDVATHVLRNNYNQTRALSQRQVSAVADFGSHVRLIETMSGMSFLDPELEFLPNQEEIARRFNAGEGLTRPELSVLLAYAKNWLFDEIINSKTPDDPGFEDLLIKYFPKQLHKFAPQLKSHRLRREIIAMRLANDVINTCGPSFPFRAADATGANPAEIALAYEAAQRIFDLEAITDAIDDLDNRVDAHVQLNLYNAISHLLREVMYRIASGQRTRSLLTSDGVDAVVNLYKDNITVFRETLADALPETGRSFLQATFADLSKAGVPNALAQIVSDIPALEFLFDVANLKDAVKQPISSASRAFFHLGEYLHLDQVRLLARTITNPDYHDKIAVRRLLEDIGGHQEALARLYSKWERSYTDTQTKAEGAARTNDKLLLDQWCDGDADGFARYKTFADEVVSNRTLTVGRLSLLNRKLADLVVRLQGT
ncbi:MAG: NAD-glutamate dehydrogenase [Pseudomonadota bacterium]